MQRQSKSIASEVSLCSLAVQGAKAHAKQLPKEVATRASSLEKRLARVQQLNAKQEKAKQDLAQLTQALRDERKAAMAERGSILRMVEATFGARDARVKEFRPATEAKASAARTAKKKA